MNYLAHLYLSRHDESLMVGNFIADAVKGAGYKAYPKQIAEGILMHRAIDHFTDQHSCVMECKRLLYHKHGKCAGIIVDMVFDHLLASSWPLLPDISLKAFSRNTYAVLMQYIPTMPLQSRKMLPFMVAGDWLYRYRKLEGIGKSLRGLERRTAFPWPMASALEIVTSEYVFFNGQFQLFFTDLKRHLAETGYHSA